MAKENINIKMEIYSKVYTSKIKKEEQESTISMREEFYNQNSIQTPLKYPKYTFQVAHYILENRKMALDKVQVKQHILTVVSMKDNGNQIKKVEMVYFNILMELNMMENGCLIFDVDLDLISIQMEISMKEIGQMILRMELGHITILMEIFIRDSGRMVNHIVKVTISIKVERQYIKAIGLKARKKVLGNLSFKIIMDIQGNGRTIKKMVEDVIFTPIQKNIKEIG